MRNVILVVLDSLRADHLSCYGYERQTTPTIDHLARHGLLWEQAYSTCSWTKPSVASLLSGLYPSEHGVLKGPKRTRGRDGCLTDILPDTAPHVAEAFAGSGWRCGAFFNNVQLERYTGFDRGFQTYEPLCGKVDLQIERLNAWIAEAPSTPFFAYLHLMESHWPYKPRRRHVEMFGGSRDKNLFAEMSALDFARLRRSIKCGDVILSKSEMDDLIRLYDASIRRLDGKIKILNQILEQHHRSGDTSLVITADHGEEFMEHGSIGHGQSLHTEVTRVPLVIFDPQHVRAARYGNSVSLVDLPCTLLSLGGTGAEFPGNDLIGDSSLSPPYCELSIGRSFHRTIALGDWRLHRHAWNESNDDANPLGFAEQVRRGELAARESVRLYNVAADPYEHQNLADTRGYSDLVDRLTRAMILEGRHHRSRSMAESAQQVEVDECVVERLRALGYIE